MKRLLTAGIFGTILGIVSTGTTNASIVSSGFLDEKLTEYALSTSLDLKANQTDLTALSNKIGTLPDGITVQGMYKGWTDKNDGTTYLGIKDLNTKIGDLPTEIPNTDSIWDIYGFAERGTPIDLPDTIGGMFAMLFDEAVSHNGPSLPSIMAKILIGFSGYSGNYNARIEGLSNLTSVYNLIGDSPIVTAVKANTAKIGTLPAGYDSVGAALTAIKGIAEDAKAAALAAIPDPKQEGSSGKFVLTVDIVGDNATYHWEKIDREGETTTTTE